MSQPRTQSMLRATLVALLFVVGGLGWWPNLPAFLQLQGFVPENPRPAFSLATLRDGSFTRWVENEFNSHLGFRWVWIGIDRQVSYSAFGEFPLSSTGTRIVASPHDWLFEENYIKRALEPGHWDDAEAATAAKRWRHAQDTLDGLGVPLLLVIAPSKAEVYPERLPASYRRIGTPQNFTTNFERLRPALNAAGVRWYDGPQRFQDWKAEGKQDLFARSGSHWNRLHVAQVAAEVRDVLNPLLQTPLPPITFTVAPPGPPDAQDLELLRTGNLLFPRLHAHALSLPRLEPNKDIAAEALPRILFVNDSFGWSLIETLSEANAIRRGPSLFYFANTYEGANRERAPDAPLTYLDAERLRDFDAVVVIMTEIAVDQNGWGFLNHFDAPGDAQSAAGVSK